MADYINVSGMPLADILAAYPQADATQLFSNIWLGGGGALYLDPNTFQVVSALQATDPVAYEAQRAQSAAEWQNNYLNSELYNPNGANTDLINSQFNTNTTTNNNTTSSGTGIIANAVNYANNNPTQTVQSPAAVNAVNQATTPVNNSLNVSASANNPRDLVNANTGQWQNNPGLGVNSVTLGPTGVRNNLNTNQNAGVLTTTGNQGAGNNMNNANNQTYMNRAMNGWSV